MALNAPIQQHVEALAVERGYPRAAVEACLRQPGQAIPPLFALLQRAARGLKVDDAEAAQFFLGIHILAQLRYKPACAPLLRLLRGDVESLDYLLSDAVFETLPKLVASLYDDDADALFDMVVDAGIDECIRDALWGAVGTLTFTDRISRETTVAFITRYDDERLAPDADMGWCGWLEAIMVLGLADLVPRAEAVWSDGRLPEGTIDRAAFEEGLAASVKGEPILPDGFGTIDDVATDLDWVDWERSDEPYVNPMRDVGRNDPCPCGSGKKAKKCCLALA